MMFDAPWIPHCAPGEKTVTIDGPPPPRPRPHAPGRQDQDGTGAARKSGRASREPHRVIHVRAARRALPRVGGAIHSYKILVHSYIIASHYGRASFFHTV
jgi:hypothetical protein